MFVIVNTGDCEEHGVAGIFTTKEKAICTFGEYLKKEAFETYENVLENVAEGLIEKFVIDDKLPSEDLPLNTVLVHVATYGDTDKFEIVDEGKIEELLQDGYHGYELEEVETDTWFEEWL